MLALLTLFHCLFMCFANEVRDGDRVEKVPLANFSPSFGHYSGYLDVGGDRKLHYCFPLPFFPSFIDHIKSIHVNSTAAFVESQNNPETDPLVLWLQGGPGCSAMDAMLRENGPFRVSWDGTRITENPYAWNKLSNVLYIEAPAGVGFSLAEEQFSTDDFQTIEDLIKALSAFTDRFKSFTNRNFFITGESYAGVYVPLLAATMLDRPDVTNLTLKGIAVGNGAFSDKANTNSILLWLYGHGFISRTFVQNAADFCCGSGSSPLTCDFASNMTKNETCSENVKEAQMKVYTLGLDPYNAYYSCYSDDFGNTTLQSTAKKPCTETQGSTIYLNRPDVQEALHVDKTWAMCNTKLNYTKKLPEMRSYVLKILREGIDVLFYTGDFDMMCNVLGTEMFVDSLQLTQNKSHEIWSCGDQTAGFWSAYSEDDVFLDFFSVRGASHFVPNDKPRESLQLLGHFLTRSREYSKPVAIPPNSPVSEATSALEPTQTMWCVLAMVFVISCVFSDFHSIV